MTDEELARAVRIAELIQRRSDVSRAIKTLYQEYRELDHRIEELSDVQGP